MIINNIEQSDFKVLSSKITPIEVQENNEFSILELKLYVAAKTQDELNLKISNLIKEFKKCIIKLENSVNEFVGLISTNPSISAITGLNYEISLSIKGYLRGPLKVYNINANSYKITINGNRECGIKISYIAIIDHVDLNLCGYQIKNVKKNDKIILDGIKGKITKNGVNCFLDTNIFKFPSLTPGEHILISNVSNITIEYYPLYY